jgi:pre-mRNA-splicing factor ISY1
MARNVEKARFMLNRWTSLKEGMAAGERGGPERRPFLASECKVLPEAERWRRQVIAEITRKIAEVQNAGLGEARLRDLNDEVNKLLREKGHWERQIKGLGGPDYAATAPKIADADGRELPGARGYKYFGAAKDLPGVRELFAEAEAAAAAGRAGAAARRTRGEIGRGITPDYYGFRDEDDGVLVKLEAARTAQLRAQLHNAWLREREDGGGEGEGEEGAGATTKRARGEGSGAGAGSSAAVAAAGGAAEPLALRDVQALLAARKQAILEDKYGGVGAGTTTSGSRDEEVVVVHTTTTTTTTRH